MSTALSFDHVIGKYVNDIWLTYLWCWTYGEIAIGNIFHLQTLIYDKYVE